MTLRPEMTPTVARMVAAKRRELGFPLRLFSIPNLFRYERPQRGRLREHWQLNVDLFGSKSPASDVEILTIAHDLMIAFGAKEEDFVIKVSNRKWVEWVAAINTFDKPEKQLGVRRKLLRLLDTKNKISKEDFSAGLKELKIPEDIFLSPESISDKVVKDLGITSLINQLKSAGFSNVKFDPSIVRGFDYYTGMVFEVFDTHPDNNRALFGGGRYDNLTALFDDEPISGVGFGMGDATIENFLEVRGLKPAYIPATQVYIAVASDKIVAHASSLAEELRKSGVNVAVDFGEKKLADQIKTATKHKIPYLIVVGEDELESNTFKIRNLQSGEEVEKPRTGLASYLASL